MMSSKEYWELDGEQRIEQDKIDSKYKEPIIKYFLWSYDRVYGWRMSGLINGYNSIEKLKNDQVYQANLKDETTIQKILKATEIDAQEILCCVCNGPCDMNIEYEGSAICKDENCSVHKEV